MSGDVIQGGDVTEASRLLLSTLYIGTNLAFIWRLNNWGGVAASFASQSVVSF